MSWVSINKQVVLFYTMTGQRYLELNTEVMYFFIAGFITYISFCCCVWQFYVVGTDPNLQMRIPTNYLISELTSEIDLAILSVHPSNIYTLSYFLGLSPVAVATVLLFGSTINERGCFAYLDWPILHLSYSPFDLNNNRKARAPALQTQVI